MLNEAGNSRAGHLKIGGKFRQNAVGIVGAAINDGRDIALGVEAGGVGLMASPHAHRQPLAIKLNLPRTARNSYGRPRLGAGGGANAPPPSRPQSAVVTAFTSV
jgi:hypothetical protein